MRDRRTVPTSQGPAPGGPLQRRALPRVFLGVDGGGSSSQAALWEMADNGATSRCVSSTSFGPLSLKSSSEVDVLESALALKAFIDDAAGEGISIAGATLGLSGLDNARDLEDLSRILALARLADGVCASIPYGHVLSLTDGPRALLCSDAILPLFCCGKSHGTVLIAGTGSVAYAVSPQGALARFGGWGYRISDEGSGQWIGCEFMRAALHGAERWLAHRLEGEHTTNDAGAGEEGAPSRQALPQIARDAMDAIGIPASPTGSPNPFEPASSQVGCDAIASPADDPNLRRVRLLFDWCIDHDSPRDFAALAKPALRSCAPEAKKIKKRAARRLARLAALACESCVDPSEGGAPSPDVVIGGALFNDPGFLRHFERALASKLAPTYGNPSVLRPQRPPTFGAAMLAKSLFEDA